MTLVICNYYNFTTTTLHVCVHVCDVTTNMASSYITITMASLVYVCMCMMLGVFSEAPQCNQVTMDHLCGYTLYLNVFSKVKCEVPVYLRYYNTILTTFTAATVPFCRIRISV